MDTTLINNDFFGNFGKVSDEPGWLGTPDIWEQLPLPPVYIKVEYDNKDKTDG
jgi:hypothetical protein